MKIEGIYETTMVWQITNYMRENAGLTDVQAGLLTFAMEDNILMTIKVEGKLRRVSWRYWRAYVQSYSDCCGMCNDDTLHEVDRSKKELLKNSTELTDHAIDY